ncbi:glycosyltransferase [Azospirillum aestuarii]|uniref:glycosyltransferase n=1 Tax=Azospirillum aestuarii TaxID=2802052 RepID=UPI0040550391
MHKNAGLTLLVSLFRSYHGWMGGINYVTNFIKTMDSLPEQKKPSIYVFNDTPGEWPSSVEEACSLDVVKAVIGPQGAIIRASGDESGRFLLHVPAAERRRAIARSVTAIVPMPMGETPMVTTPRHWAWIPDFQHRRLLALFNDAEKQYRDDICRVLADRDGPLILSSRSALFDFQEFFPSHRARPYVWPFVSTISTGESAPVRTVIEKYGLPLSFLYIPNQFWVHKDHQTAFNAVRLLKERGFLVDLVCTGSTRDYRHNGYFETLFSIVKEQGLESCIRHLGVIPQDEQIALLRACTAVIQPSLFEGWSTVVEDARAVGCPLIVSDFAVHREQLGAQGHFFRAGDPEDLAGVIARTLPNLPPRRGAEAEQAACEASLIRRRACAETFLNDLIRESRV